MKTIMGIEYGRGCLRTAIDGGPTGHTKNVSKCKMDICYPRAI